MDSISPPNRPHYPWRQGEILIADELNAAIANAGHGTRVTDWIPGGQPDGVTDLAAYFQEAIDVAADADPVDRASAPGLSPFVVPANPLPYIIGSSLYIPSNSHIIVEAGATLKLAPQTNANMFLLCSFAHHILIEMYGTLDGNSSQQSFTTTDPISPPPTNKPATSISGGIRNDWIWGGPTRNPAVQGGICSHVRIIGDRNGLITNFQNSPLGFDGATNCEVSGISMTSSAFQPGGSVGINGWRNFPYDPATGLPLTFTGTFVAATGIATLTTSVPHCMVAGEEFITETLTGTGGFNAATGKLFITLPGTAGNTIIYAATDGGVGTDGTITAGTGRITSWYYQQATIVSGTYIPATGLVTVVTTAPHQLVYGQQISANITSGTGAANATGLFQLLDVTQGEGEPVLASAKNVTLRYRAGKTGTIMNITADAGGTVSKWDPATGIVTLVMTAPHGLTTNDVVTVAPSGSGFLAAIRNEHLCIAGTTGSTIKYQGPTSIPSQPPVITGGTVYGAPTQTITGGTIGVSTKSWNSGFDNCYMDQIRDQGPCIYGGGVGCYIRRSEITRQLGAGVGLFSDLNSGRCVDCEISGNYVHDNYGAGISVALVTQTNDIPHIGTRIFDNYVTGNRGGASLGSCDGLDISNNRFFANRAQGLNTYGSVGEIAVGQDGRRVNITGNTIRDPCQISTPMAGTALVQVDHGTYNNATGEVILYTLIPHNLYTNAYFTLLNATPTAALNGRWITTAQPVPTELHFQAGAGLGAFSITGGQLVPNGFGIVVHYAQNLYIADNFIGDYQSTPTMLAAIGGVWGPHGVCNGNYYGPRINATGNFPADMSAGARRSGNVDTVTGFTDGTTLVQPFSNDPGENFPPLGVSVGHNRSGSHGESTFYVGAGNASPGGFEFVKVIGLAVASGTYDPATANVVLTTRTAHGLPAGARFNLSLVLGNDSIGFTNVRDIFKLNGNWIATAGTAGTTLNFVLTTYSAGALVPYTGLDILSITAGAINASAMDSGLIDTTAGSGGVLFAVDGHGNAVVPGTLTVGGVVDLGAGINSQMIATVTANSITVPAGTNYVVVSDSVHAVNTLTVGSGTLADGYDLWMNFPNGGVFAGQTLTAHGNLTLKVLGGGWSILSKFG